MINEKIDKEKFAYKQTFLVEPELKKSLSPKTSNILFWAKKNKIDCQIYSSHLLVWEKGKGPMIEIEIWFACEKDLLRFQLEWL